MNNAFYVILSLPCLSDVDQIVLEEYSIEKGEEKGQDLPT